MNVLVEIGLAFGVGAVAAPEIAVQKIANPKNRSLTAEVKKKL